MNWTPFIKQLSRELGFDHCGIAKATQLDDDARRLETWLNKGMHGNMHYMENHFDKRIDPRKLVDGAQSVITLLFNYFPEEKQTADAPRISKYAYGQDYHEVIRDRLKTMLLRMQEKIGPVQGRGFVDSAPVLERSWAKRSGLGWIGKNGNLINKQTGSFFFIATLITDIPLDYDNPVADFCGTCTRCLDACPTGALVAPGVVDGSRCISYYTIELKEQLIPDKMKGQFDNWMFGCDTCQDVCPWNRFAKAHQEAAFTPIPAILNFTTKDWEALTEESFKTIFRHSPMKRSKYAGIRRNLKFLED
ncbi:tRNA epoxyqueuosine(34) reductase QueG [Chitinophaga nivalis]|uniref:Epoxyqueuosine reductase n=1 Tax=Chitinophaga nivalis TaxID=2991709 RepID=A0ABT3IHG4_9BACT|nr:tRNA epoxyqueuosine(34) reductase QueG [Chitinophaga nivalis]MCW3466896.1 tRNA epoxyqueuosine(34) reductase QueG [Chitinophaga nivalis]MCW3483413.1 tRNA epoxyqueuosine(34) reductase QueG [Chitinophaga nivalis]